MADDLWVRDSLVEDAVEAQKASGGTPDVKATSDYIVSVLESMDRKSADVSDVKTSAQKAPRDKSDAIETEYERRTGRNMAGGWETSKREAKPQKLVQIDEVERVGRKRLAARLRWMRSKPDLRREVEAIAPLLHSKQKDTREKAATKLRALIAKSDRLAGHSWMKPPPQKLFF